MATAGQQNTSVLITGQFGTASTGIEVLSTSFPFPAVPYIQVGFPVSVKDPAFNAKGDGITDDTAAIQAATNTAGNNGIVSFPSGTYLITNIVISNLSNWKWIGSGLGGVILTTKSAGTGAMLTLNGCNFSTIDGFTFQPTGPSAAVNGLLITSTTNNTVVKNCIFQNWSGAGAKCVGTVATPQSGNQFMNNYFLQNAAGSGAGQLDNAFDNDFFIANNQFGILGSPASFPTYGVNLNSCSDGDFFSNDVWENTQGINIVNCAFNRIVANRIEQSQHEGAIFNAGGEHVIEGNWFNNNGIAAVNTYNQVRLIGLADTSFQGNILFDNSGGTNSAKYSVSVESTCLTTVLRGNTADKYGTAAWNFDSSESFTSLTTDGALQFFSGGTVNAATTTFVGIGTVNATGSFTQQFLVVRHTIVQLWVACSSAPGGGQTFTYTLYKNGVTTGVTATISGGSSFTAGINLSTTVVEDVPNNASYSVQLVTSAGAASATHWANVIFCER